ncbi:MAG: glycosyltransferase [Anaerolineales bacterium]|nr:glycosyltransferase [Anaerolineales bacterium]
MSKIDSDALPKVLMVDLSLKYGGSTSRALALMQNSPPGKIALAGLKSGAIVTEAQKLGLPVHVVGARKTDPRILLNLIKLIRIEGYQVLDTQNIQSKFWGSLASLLTKASLISTINSWYANEHGQASTKGKIYTALELSTNLNLDLYITVSEKDRKALIRSGIAEDRIRLIYNAVAITPELISGDAEWLRQKFNLPKDALVCTAVGRLVPVKGYDVLVEAFKQIEQKVPRLVCLLVGDGECKAQLEEQIKRLGLEGRVFLAGYQDRDMALMILKASSIFAMPSRYEGTPIALLEAAALGLPILASSGGGIPELVADNEQALLIPPNDPTGLANGLVKLCEDPAFAERIGKNAQVRIRDHFNLAGQIEATWSAYQTADQRRRLNKL